jgi:PAS domain S-box-containing protein
MPEESRLASIGKWFLSLQQRMIFMIVCSAFLLGTAVFFFVYVNARAEVKKLYFMEHKNSIDMLGQILKERLSKARDVGISLAIRPLVVQALKEDRWEDAVKCIANIHEAIPFIDRVFFADTTSLIKSDSQKLANAVGTTRPETDWYQGVSRHWEPYVSEAFYRRSVPRGNVVNVVIPVMDDQPGIPDSPGVFKNGFKVLGLLILQMKLDRFSEVFQEDAHINDRRNLFIVDQHGRLVSNAAQKDNNEERGLFLAPEVVSLLQKDAIQPQDIRNWNEKNGSFLTRKVMPYGWKVVCYDSVQVVRRHIDASLQYFLNVMIVFYLAYIVLFLWIWGLMRAVFRNREELRKSEVWWRSLIQEVPAVTFVLQCDGVIKSVNRSFAGLSTDHLTGRSLFEFLDLHEKKMFEDALRQILKERRSVTLQSRVMTPQGVIVWYESHLGPIGNRGDVNDAVCLSFDITERKMADDRLREMSLAVEHSPVSVAITDRFGKIEYVNVRFSVSTGYSFVEIFGKVLRILRPGELSDAVTTALWRALKAGANWQGEFLEKRKDGSKFWESVTIAPVPGQDGEISHLIVLKEDVTARRSVQEQRDLDLKFLSELLEAIPSPLFFKDSEGRYQRCNKAFEDFVGKPRSKIIGKDVVELLPEDLSEVHRHADQEVLRRGGRYVYEAKFMGADGVLHDVMMSKSVLKDRSGMNTGLIGVILDITDRKRLENELRTNEEQLIGALEEVKLFNAQLENTQEKMLQQEKLAAIGFLAAGVAHEINNPLGFVIGNLEALKGYVDVFLKMLKLCDDLAAAVGTGDLAHSAEINLEIQKLKDSVDVGFIVKDVDELLEQTRVGSERIKKIVLGLKSFSRTNNAEMIMANMNDILEGVIPLVINEIKYKAEVHKEYGSVPMIMCNPQQISQIFVNLFVNASQAIREKGNITAKTFLQENEVVVQISDTGAGISAENLNKIFDPFFTTKEPGQGTGLGLSISYDIIKKHGGRIEVSSEVGKGAMFTLYFPVDKT